MSAAEKEKRRYGSGTIRKNNRGLFEGRYQNSDYNGGKSKSIYGKTENEVKKKLRELEKQVKSQCQIEIPKKTVETYMMSWLENVKRNELKDTSYDRLEVTIKNQITPNIGSIQIANLSANDVQKLVNTLTDNGLSYSTVKKTYDAINDCFRSGVIKGDIVRNPALGVKLNAKKKKANADIAYFTEEEVNKLVETAKSRYDNGKLKYRLGYAVILVLNTGLRVGELLALKWADIDFLGKTMSISNSLVQVIDRREDAEHKYILMDQSSTKSASGQRVLHLNNSSIESLLEIEKDTGGMRYICSSKSNHAISPRNMDRLLRNLCRVAGFTAERTFGMHALRHTFASRLFAKGVDVKIVSEILGHSDIQITYNIYIHIISEQKKQAIEIIDDII